MTRRQEYDEFAIMYAMAEKGKRAMNGGIFLIHSNGELIEMTEQPYNSEDMLQQLLAHYPNLLAGDQMDAASPRRWLLVKREMGVPSEEAGGDIWSLDYLFLDQDAIPTLVEVKRRTDTRLRREVVGQMLDYAANAVVYWPVETIRVRFEEDCRKRGLDPAKEVETLLGLGGDTEGFWQRVKTNLQAGRVRMVFVADVIPAELCRIVEFLNGQMDPAEVLAVEIKQFVGEGLKVLVPRLIGNTAEANRTKGGASGRGKSPWGSSEHSHEEVLAMIQAVQTAGKPTREQVQVVYDKMMELVTSQLKQLKRKLNVTSESAVKTEIIKAILQKLGWDELS